MSFSNIRQIPKAKDIIEKLPLPAELKKIKKEKDREIQGVLTGAVDKLLLVIGPCSAHDEDAVCDYISRLAEVQDEVKDKIILIPAHLYQQTAYHRHRVQGHGAPAESQGGAEHRRRASRPSGKCTSGR